MKKLKGYLMTAFIITILLLMGGNARTADPRYLGDMDNPSHVWWISVVFFEGENGKFNDDPIYRDGLFPRAAGNGDSGFNECWARVGKVYPWLKRIYPSSPWIVTCTLIDNRLPDNLHMYNRSRVIQDFYTDKPVWDDDDIHESSPSIEIIEGEDA